MGRCGHSLLFPPSRRLSKPEMAHVGGRRSGAAQIGQRIENNMEALWYGRMREVQEWGTLEG